MSSSNFVLPNFSIMSNVYIKELTKCFGSIFLYLSEDCIKRTILHVSATQDPSTSSLQSSWLAIFDLLTKLTSGTVVGDPSEQFQYLLGKKIQLKHARSNKSLVVTDPVLLQGWRTFLETRRLAVNSTERCTSISVAVNTSTGEGHTTAAPNPIDKAAESCHVHSSSPAIDVIAGESNVPAGTTSLAAASSLLDSVTSQSLNDEFSDDRQFANDAILCSRGEPVSEATLPTNTAEESPRIACAMLNAADEFLHYDHRCFDPTHPTVNLVTTDHIVVLETVDDAVPATGTELWCDEEQEAIAHSTSLVDLPPLTLSPRAPADNRSDRAKAVTASCSSPADSVLRREDSSEPDLLDELQNACTDGDEVNANMRFLDPESLGVVSAAAELPPDKLVEASVKMGQESSLQPKDEDETAPAGSWMPVPKKRKRNQEWMAHIPHVPAATGSSLVQPSESTTSRPGSNDTSKIYFRERELERTLRRDLEKCKRERDDLKGPANQRRKELENRIKQLKVNCLTARQCASDGIWLALNPGGNMEWRQGIVAFDFHGQHVDEALVKLNSHVLPALECSGKAYVVTGFHDHGRGEGGAKLKREIKTYIEKTKANQLKCTEVGSNNGILLVESKEVNGKRLMR